MRYFLLLLITLLALPFYYSEGQQVRDLSSRELDLQAMFRQAKLAQTDEEKFRINDSIALLLSRVLTDPASFSYPLDSLRQLGKVTSPDNKIRIYTWNLVTSAITYRYYGFIQHIERNKEMKLYRLDDLGTLDKNAGVLVSNPSNWYGCLIYKILQNRVEGRDLYTFLATDMNNMLSGKKIIDCLWFDETGQPFFGLPVFTDPKGQVMNRVVFEYASQAVMGLTWEPRMEMILFDHLSPIQPGMEGNYKFYGPDLSIDGYRFEKGKWIYVPEVQVKTE
ncbi:MAG: hypothetical protein U0T82_15480 [Bacteroidales bacterium]